MKNNYQPDRWQGQILRNRSAALSRTISADIGRKGLTKGRCKKQLSARSVARAHLKESVCCPFDNRIGRHRPEGVDQGEVQKNNYRPDRSQEHILRNRYAALPATISAVIGRKLLTKGRCKKQLSARSVARAHLKESVCCSFDSHIGRHRSKRFDQGEV